MTNELTVQIDPEHIQNAEKSFLLRGQPSRYLRTFKKHLEDVNPALCNFLVELCEATNLDSAIVKDDTYILIDFSVLQSHLEKQGKPSSRGTINNRITDSLDLKLGQKYTTDYISETGKRAYPKQILVFNTPLELEGTLSELSEQHNKTASNVTKASNIKSNQELKRIFESDNLLLPPAILNELESSNSKTIILLKNWMTLGRGWRISSNHGDPKEPTVLNLGKNRYVPVKVTAPADLSGTAIQDDQKLLAILLNYCARSNRYQKSLGNTVTNTYIVDVAEICKLLASWDAQLSPEFQKMTPAEQKSFIKKRKRDRASGGYRKVVIRGLYRLHFTTHLIQLDNSVKSETIRKMLGLLPGINRYSTRFLTTCDAQDQLNEETTNYEAKWFRISLDEMTYYSLLDGFNSPDALAVLGHKELLVSGSGILMLLYNLVNAHVGRSASNRDKHAEYSIEQLHKYLAPNSKSLEFEEYFNNAILSLYKNSTNAVTEKWQKNGFNSFTALGYHMTWNTIDNKIVSCLFRRDVSDYLTGDDSYHNKHRQRSIAQALGENVDDMFPDTSGHQQGLFDDTP